MKRISFKCTLLSDVIINQKSASTGNQNTLDFIPGSNFYGIIANRFYNDASIADKDRFTLLHSGKLQFGDAHPSMDGERSLRVPAAMYYPKLKGMDQGCYINHALYGLPEARMKELAREQLKQCRTGFYVFGKDGLTMTQIQVDRTFAMKSAYDHNKRRAKDEQMYGYQSMDKGLELIFHIHYDECLEAYMSMVKDVLCGEHRVGRSRTAQYGLVAIAPLATSEDTQSIDIEKGQEVAVYADSRLIFFDRFNLPTFRPTAEDLGFDGGRIVWEKSQIRTFQYAPWNFKRQAYDADRCGIEKGSVIIVETNAGMTRKQEDCVGMYQTEGFGHVLIDPPFLTAEADGKARCRLLQTDEPQTAGLNIETIRKNMASGQETDPLLNYLYREAMAEYDTRKIYVKVNKFVNDNTWKFTGSDRDAFASQWGQIRSIASQCRDKETLETLLYNNKDVLRAYLIHGVAKEKWDTDNRLEDLKAFISSFDEVNAPRAVVNLAAAMGKVCGADSKTKKRK